MYRREMFVRLSADMKWIGYSSTARMRMHLGDFVCNKELVFERILKESTKHYQNRVEMCINCGKVAARSYFVFFRCSRKKSRIIGVCSTNKLVELIEDFNFLKKQMKKSNLGYSIGDPKVFLDNSAVFNTSDKQRLSLKGVIPELLGTIGFISGAISYFVFGEFNQITVTAFILGLFFWLGSVIFGSGNSKKYVYIEQE
jgi:hypothetical protein